MPAIEEPQDDQLAVIGGRSVDPVPLGVFREKRAALEEEVRGLAEKIRDIDTQLASRDRRYPGDHEFAGERMTDKDFWTWRGRAVAAKNHLTADIGRARADLKDLVRQRSQAKSDWLTREANGEVLLALRRMVYRAITDYGLVPTPKEQGFLDLMTDVGDLRKHWSDAAGAAPADGERA